MSVRVVLKDEDILPGGVTVGPVHLIEDGKVTVVDGGHWQTYPQAEELARKHGVTLEVE